MSASGGGKAIIAAFLANMGIAVGEVHRVTRLGVGSMLAEAIHSVADSGNQLLLLLGGRHGAARGRRRASVRLRPRALRLRVRRVDHPVLGRRALLDLRGRREAHAPARAREHLGAARRARRSPSCSSRFSLRTAVKESNHVRAKGQSWVSFVRHAKAPELPVVLLEDVARPHRPGLRPVRRRPHGDHRQPRLRRDRHADDRHAADRRRDRARHRDEEPARRRGRDRGDQDRIVAAIEDGPEVDEAHPHQDALPRSRRAARRREARLRRGPARSARSPPTSTGSRRACARPCRPRASSTSSPTSCVRRSRACRPRRSCSRSRRD